MSEPKRRLSLRPRPDAAGGAKALPWPILVVDDDPHVHAMTQVLLRDF
jgi:two-component system cell cycle response regulator